MTEGQAVALQCIEASAGTGKTHRLSSIAVTMIVDGDALVSELLVVTYTIAAAAELRERIRGRLAEVRDTLAPSAPRPPDELLVALAARGDRDAVRERVSRALTEFDTATISTIHSFAASALSESGGAVAPSEARRREAVADVLCVAAFDRDAALWSGANANAAWLDRLVRLRLEHPDVELVPREGAHAPAELSALRDLAESAVAAFAERQRRDGTRTYADLLTDLDAALREDDSALLRVLRARFKVGLIDEFQDTDPTQWAIFRRLFLEGPDQRLVVVGDPKQAIYGFRGADVHTYLAAMQDASKEGHLDRLGTNYRSDGVLLDALNGLFDGATFDEDGLIDYQRVEAPPESRDRRLAGHDGARLAPLSIRVAAPAQSRDEMRAVIAEECAEEAARALRCVVVAPDGSERALTEDDVVVLCARRADFSLLKEAFLRRGIRTTESRSDDVLEAPAALHVEVALRALADPDDPGAVAALARSRFGAARGGDGGVGAARGQLEAWRAALESRGVAALGRAMTGPACLTGLLRQPGGERFLTDVQHVFDLLASHVLDGVGAAALLEAMEELRASSTQEGDEGTRARRIDTDVPAVRFMTVHGAKGLQFGVVLCPFVSKTGPPDKLVVWRDDAAGHRLADVAGGEEWTDPSLSAATKEDRGQRAEAASGGEARRLLYVALTRAEHRCAVWWMPAWQAARTRDELAGLLFDRDPAHRPIQRPRAERVDEGAAPYTLAGPAALAALRDHFAELCERGLLDCALTGELAAGTGAQQVLAGAPDGRAPLAELGVSALGRRLGLREQRSSFSSLVSSRRAAHDGLDVAGGDAGALDEGAGDEQAADVATDPFDGLAGTSFGTAMHEALEVALRRPRTVGFDDAATGALRDALRHRSLVPGARVAGGLLAAAAVPVAEGAALRDLHGADAATEMRFSLPVAEGVDLGAIGAAIARLDPDGPFAGWARAIEGPVLGAALVGSIDLVTSFGTNARFGVVDYKTNLRATGYGTEDLHQAMREADYPLQAALYLVALHRYLRWRLDGYDPERNLGGAHYLFLRGMAAGAGGVVTWNLAPRAVAGLSDLLAGAT